MSLKTHTRLTPRQRLTRGLTYTAVGPVDITRGVVGLGLHSAQAGAAHLRRRYRQGRLARDLASAQESIVQDLAAAGQVASALPAALQQARRSQRRSKRRWIIVGVAASVLAAGAAAFTIIRRSTGKEPSPRPPSVNVHQRP